MYALEKIQLEISNHAENDSAQVFSRLIQALEQQEDFPLHELYDLNYSQFQLALELLQTWRLARHFPHAVQRSCPAPFS